MRAREGLPVSYESPYQQALMIDSLRDQCFKYFRSLSMHFEDSQGFALHLLSPTIV